MFQIGDFRTAADIAQQAHDYGKYMVFITRGIYSLRRHRLIGIGIPIINLRRIKMGIPIPIRRYLFSR